MSARMVNKIQRLYSLLEAKNPLLAKSLMGALISGLGSMIGLAFLGPPATTQQAKRRRGRGKASGIDWLEVATFTVYGAVVGGPIGHYWDRWMRHHGPELRTNAMLFDQIVAQPPRLLLMAVFLDMVKVSLQEIPTALQRSWNQFTPKALKRSWIFWPVVAYASSRFLSKRKHYERVMKFCALFWACQLARLRARDRQQMIERAGGGRRE